MSFTVTLIHQGNTFYLRNTVWTSERDRATTHTTREAAQKALDKAKPFMKARQYKAANILFDGKPTAPQIYGMVVVNGTEYQDDDMARLIGTKVGTYGKGWTYGGDQGFDESNIAITIGEKQTAFDGRTGLNQALAYLAENGVAAPASNGDTLSPSARPAKAKRPPVSAGQKVMIDCGDAAYPAKVVALTARGLKVEWDEDGAVATVAMNRLQTAR